MTAAVFGGGFFLIEQLSDADNKLLGFGADEPVVVIIPNNAGKIGIENRLPSFKSSGKVKPMQQEDIISTLNDKPSLIGSSRVGTSGSTPLSLNTYAYRSESSHDNLNGSGSASMLMGLTSASSSGGNGESTELASATATNWALNASMIVANTSGYDVTNIEKSFNNTGSDAYRASNELTAAEGGSVGDGLLIMFLFVGAYYVYRKIFTLKLL